jgi:hypothetical protein
MMVIMMMIEIMMMIVSVVATGIEIVVWRR